MTSATPMNPKKMKVSELRAALESRGLSFNGLKTELIQRLELALDEEEFGSEAQEMEELKAPSPKQTKKTDLKKKDSLAGVASMQDSSKGTKSYSQSFVENAEPFAKNATTTPVEKIDNVESDPVAGAVVPESDTNQVKLNRTQGNEADMGTSSQPMTEKVKRAARAAKYGIPLSLVDKKALRAKRFHLPSAGACFASKCILRKVLHKSTFKVADEENGKRLKRAERFQIETKDTLEKKKEARAERFGLNVEEKRRLERAKRFGLETSELLEEKRRKRLERFATALI
ncbi:Scaffold/matrix specific factor hnRNP-U/SAF-A, contains SPRY domain [Plasmopara halstedii]|uniref:Scaffold/matrix specific factor hnRNP-U/SAF-A, contains SPRY domain n=1 Tax=Plasmopara halstedii TaxID=4781 RepID=A0A0P1A658_PLAHL|nr:Scaffold/matrix specific factor hnRNP-U/SAF-A, contains SPRY domain [Plasmopara halstedii]CEG36034.1 Scaffold/matrix specific factor hnRNP-U/SAF-A, contains SPRY domain [Plasmopara halstedii]|eukprot:XP_024572403.1 Scaffold/matrix specific factor hnRNP-U/SAF-A, contains SPRY domain [Plasmopara halstedii]